ncbi:MAG: hypothetical protein WA966_14475 [Ornithinimicrobium sp.]
MQIELADAWSGWASTLLGGVVGAVTVVVGVWLAYQYGERSRRDEMHDFDERQAANERAAAAAQLMVEVSNLRDQVCGRRKGLTGESELWKLRNALFTTHLPLGRYPSYHVVRNFYATSLTWRQWVRDSQSSVTADELPAQYPVVQEYQAALACYGDDVIKVLQDHLEDFALTVSMPALPRLPSLPGR